MSTKMCKPLQGTTNEVLCKLLTFLIANVRKQFMSFCMPMQLIDVYCTNTNTFRAIGLELT